MNPKVESKLMRIVSGAVGKSLVGAKFYENIYKGKKILILKLDFDNLIDQEHLILVLDRKLTISDLPDLYKQVTA